MTAWCATLFVFEKIWLAMIHQMTTQRALAPSTSLSHLPKRSALADALDDASSQTPPMRYPRVCRASAPYSSWPAMALSAARSILKDGPMVEQMYMDFQYTPLTPDGRLASTESWIAFRLDSRFSAVKLFASPNARCTMPVLSARYSTCYASGERWLATVNDAAAPAVRTVPWMRGRNTWRCCA